MYELMRVAINCDMQVDECSDITLMYKLMRVAINCDMQVDECADITLNMS